MTAVRAWPIRAGSTTAGWMTPTDTRGPAPSSTAPTVKRTLPLRVDPLPGEALESWLAALATRMNATWGEVLDAVLPTGVNGTASSHRGAVLTTAVSDAERDSISAATGVSAGDIDTMTLAGHYGSPLITIDARTGRARTPWGLLYRQRFCPLCMRTLPGRRKLEWYLAVDLHLYRTSVLARRYLPPVRANADGVGLVQPLDVHPSRSLPPDGQDRPAVRTVLGAVIDKSLRPTPTRESGADHAGHTD